MLILFTCNNDINGFVGFERLYLKEAYWNIYRWSDMISGIASEQSRVEDVRENIGKTEKEQAIKKNSVPLPIEE